MEITYLVESGHLTPNDTGNPVNKELLKTNLNITSFGIDEKNELYICADDGRIYGIIKSR